MKEKVYKIHVEKEEAEVVDDSKLAACYGTISKAGLLLIRY